MDNDKAAQAPTLYQYRTMPTWHGGQWTEWANCTAESAADYRKTPLLHDWRYEVRELFAAPVAADAASPCEECGGSTSIKNCPSKHCPQAAQPDESAAFCAQCGMDADPRCACSAGRAARATAPQATLTKIAESNAELRAQIDRYQAICASAYQLAGAVDAPLRFLDALASAANGEPVSEESALDLLPVTVEECAVVPKGATLTDEQRGAVEWAIRKMDSPHIGSEAQRNCETLRTLLDAQAEK